MVYIFQKWFTFFLCIYYGNVTSTKKSCATNYCLQAAKKESLSLLGFFFFFITERFIFSFFFLGEKAYVITS